ncbi:MAG: glycosyltransferase [Acidobacteria bacterium]|nr:glycosyltransferase [Acidobacteriota bacterium]
MRVALDDYAEAAGPEAVQQIRELARPLRGKSVVHVNSTRIGGGVAEILARLVPLMADLGLDARWEVIDGTPEFFSVTKSLHNALQGDSVTISTRQLDVYQEVSRRNAESLRDRLKDADYVFIHDPQPAALLQHFADRRGKWVWRCHIDVSRPFRQVWKILRGFIRPYDASVFSLAAFAQPLSHPQYLIAPSIDPLSEKNIPLDAGDVEEIALGFDLEPSRPVILQVSRFDRFKDPVGVIRAYRLVKPHIPIQLVLAGGTADDDPEGAEVLSEVRAEAGDDPDIHVLELPPDSHRAINALQRHATLVLQKSTREGFGLTVTEAMWKEKAVIGGETGGIPLQVVNYHTGFLVSSPEGAALRMRYLLSRPELMATMGRKGRRFVRENFLLTRHLREYLTLILGLHYGASESVEIR